MKNRAQASMNIPLRKIGEGWLQEYLEGIAVEEEGEQQQQVVGGRVAVTLDAPDLGRAQRARLLHAVVGAVHDRDELELEQVLDDDHDLRPIQGNNYLCILQPAR